MVIVHISWLYHCNLKVMKEVGIVLIKAGSDSEHSWCVQVHVVGIGLLGLQQEFKPSWDDTTMNTLYQRFKILN